MSLLDPDHTVQASSSLSAAVASVRSWIDGTTSTCVVVASTGSGKSHLLAAAGHEVDAPLVMPAADGSDCTEFLAALKSSSGRAVIADDLDKVAKGVREDVIKLVASSNHSLLASMSDLFPRIRNLLLAKIPDAVLVFLDDSVSRPQDVEAFVERWVPLNGLAGDRIWIEECAKFCCASGLPEGLRTVDGFLRALAEAGWTFSGTLPAADAAAAYRQAILPPPTRPTLLVEGYTDRIYFEWQLRGLPSAPEIEIRDCGGATLVAEQTISLRNQGRSCVAVLDSDLIGKQLREDLRRYSHPVASVPLDAVNLPASAFDHVHRIAEIEDLLPVEMIESFIEQHECRPELEIRSPTGVRYVIGESDKRDLAKWIVAQRYDAAPKLTAFLKQALEMLDATRAR